MNPRCQGQQDLDVRVLVDRSIVEVFVGGGRVAAVMAYQPPNDVSDPKALELESFTSVHMFAGQDAKATNVKVHQMGCVSHWQPAKQYDMYAHASLKL